MGTPPPWTCIARVGPGQTLRPPSPGRQRPGSALHTTLLALIVLPVHQRLDQLLDLAVGHIGHGQHESLGVWARCKPAGTSADALTLDEAQTLDLLLPPDGSPEPGRLSIRLNDDRLQPTGASLGQSLLRLGHQSATEASTTMVRRYCEPVDRTSPSVPGGDHRPDDTVLRFGHDQSLRVPLDESPEALLVVCVGWLGGSLQP